jgi:hypothetical protein
MRLTRDIISTPLVLLNYTSALQRIYFTFVFAIDFCKYI